MTAIGGAYGVGVAFSGTSALLKPAPAAAVVAGGPPLAEAGPGQAARGGQTSKITGAGAQPLQGASALAVQEQAEASAGSETGRPGDLTPEEEEQVRKLKERDAEVRRHEEAHARVGGQYAGSPSYTFQTGPDGQKYAVGGEVPIDISPVAGDPKATVTKMDVVKRAALAPAEPSAQDRRVAAQADQQKLQAQAQVSAQARAEAAPGTPPGQDGAQNLAVGEANAGALAGATSADAAPAPSNPGPVAPPGSRLDLAA